MFTKISTLAKEKDEIEKHLELVFSAKSSLEKLLLNEKKET